MNALMVAIKFINLLSIVLWIGGMSFFSFIAAPAIFKALPRETAGEVVGVIFPRYWIMGYACSLIALATTILLSYIGKAWPWATIVILAIMTCLSFYTGMVVGTKAQTIKAAIRAESDPAKKEKMRKEFSAVHRTSAILNAAILLLGLAVILMLPSVYRDL